MDDLLQAFEERLNEESSRHDAWAQATSERLEALQLRAAELPRGAATSPDQDTLRTMTARAEHAEQLVATLRAQLAEAQQSTARLEALEAEIAELRTALDATRADLLAARDALSRATATTPPPGSAAPISERPDDAGLLGSVQAFGPKGHKKRMGEILVEAGLLSESQVEDVLAAQEADPHQRFGALVVERGYSSEQYIAAILAAQLRLPFVNLEEEMPDAEAVALLPRHLARHHHCIPLHREGEVLEVAMENPLDLIALEDIEIASKLRAAPVVAVASQIHGAIERFYG